MRWDWKCRQGPDQVGPPAPQQGRVGCYYRGEALRALNKQAMAGWHLCMQFSHSCMVQLLWAKAFIPNVCIKRHSRIVKLRDVSLSLWRHHGNNDKAHFFPSPGICLIPRGWEGYQRPYIRSGFPNFRVYLLGYTPLPVQVTSGSHHIGDQSKILL